MNRLPAHINEMTQRGNFVPLEEIRSDSKEITNAALYQPEGLSDDFESWQHLPEKWPSSKDSSE